MNVREPPSISLRDLVARYRTLLFDAYGVLVNGAGALPGAVALIDQLNHAGQDYYVLTNSASRLPETASRRFHEFGLAIAPERILTSGTLIAPWLERSGRRAVRAAVLGPDDSVQYLRRAGATVVGLEEGFDLLAVCDEAGFPFLQTVDTALSALIERLDGGGAVDLLLPNPDLVYPTGCGFGITAGAIALMMEAVLAQRYGEEAPRFVRLGKPYPAIFEEAVRRAGHRDLVMIGDQLETDIRGALDFGIDAAWLPGGVSRPRFDRIRPTWILQSLVLP